MSYEAERVSAEVAFETGWASATPIKYQNAPFTDPDGDEFVEFFVLSGPSNIASLGGVNTMHRFIGFVQIDIYVPENTGTDRARELADTAATIFRDTRIDDMLFRASDITNGATPPAGYYRLTVTVPYQRDEIF